MTSSMVRKEVEISRWETRLISDIDYSWNTDFELTYKSQFSSFRMIMFDRPHDFEVISTKSAWVTGEGIINVFPEFNTYRPDKVNLFVMVDFMKLNNGPITVSYWVTDIEQEKRNVLQKILNLENEIDHLRKELDRLYAHTKTS